MLRCFADMVELPIDADENVDNINESKVYIAVQCPCVTI